MDRSREARRASTAATNNLSKRRHRSSNLRDSAEEDAPMDLHEMVRVRDRGNGKKDRDRDRDRDWERERERDRERDRDRDRMNRSKRRRGDKYKNNREDGGDESSEESVNDEEDEDDDDREGLSVRVLAPNPVLPSSSIVSTHHHRKNFTPAKVFRATPPWKHADEMIGVPVPRKARSASTKRSHECWVSSGGTGGGGVVGDHIHQQASTSPVRPGLVVAASPAPAPNSPSSSNTSVRKKTKPSGQKLRPPPKSTSKSSSLNQEEIEIEIAEVLYGLMRQPQGSLKQETMATDLSKSDARENKSAGDAKSRVSSPVSNSPLVAPPSSSMLPHNPSSFTTPTAIAPKRKRPRPVTYNENLGISATRSSPILSTKTEIDRPAETDSASPHLQKDAVSVAENGTVSHDVLSANSTSLFPVQPENTETTDISDRKRLTEEPLDRKGTIAEADEVFSLKKESGDGKLTVGNKASSTSSAVETDREAKFEIDLMVPLPQLRSSPERAGANDHLQVPLPGSSNVDIGMRTSEKEDEKPAKLDPVNPEPEKNAKPLAEEVELLKLATKKETVLDLQLDLDKNDRDSGTAGAVGDMLHQQVTKQPQPQQNLRNDANIEKNVQSGPLPLPMSLASWPGGLPPMGYISPLPGVVSMGGGGTVTPAAIQPPHLFSQPRPKRCATHCYIARNIHYHQQFTRMNHFWPAAAAAAASTSSLYGAKPCHLNVVPPADLLGSVPGKSADTVPDKGQGLVMFPGHSSTERASQPSNIADAAVQRKQIMLQQALPAGAAPNNILHGPAFIFPLNQQQAAAAAAVSARAGSIKSSSGVGAAASSKASNPASVSSSASAAAPAVNFSYPNIPANETQYLAFLQNNGYPFPIPAHVGAPPAYRGAHAQAMPFFNGSFYSSQMLHPSSHLQQQQQVSSQTLQIQQGHQNTSLSGGSSSSQKNLQNSQQRQQSSGSLLNFPAPKSQPSQLLLQQQQRNQHASMPHQARQIENEVGGEDSPSTADSRVSRTNLNVYAQNYSMPFHPQNFALMTPAAFGGGNGNTHNDKKQAQHPQQGVKAGAEPLPSQAFAMSFANINAAAASASGFDIPSVAQNHAVLQNLPEAARHGYQLMAAAAAAAQAAQQKNFRISEDGKSGVGGESLSIEEERKKMVAKAPAPGQFIAFSRPDLIDSSACTLSGNTLADSPARTLNIGSASAAKAPNSVPTTTTGMANLSHSQRQQQQMIQLQKQHQFAVAAARNKAPATSNGCVYSEHLPSSSMAAKFPSSLSSLAPSLAQSSSNPPAGQSPQWKNSSRPTPSASQGLSPTVGSSASSSSKNPLQQPGRTPQSHAQISFGGNAKSQMQHPSPSSPMAVGSHSPSSISKSGSPRASANTTVVNKHPQSSTLQQSKGPSSIPSRKSSPVPSILGNPHISTSSSSGAGPRPQMPQQQQHHQLPKQAMQQAQMLFSNAAYSTNTAGGASAASSYYLQRRRHDQPLGTSSGMLSLCPPVDPAKAAAKGGLPSQGIFQAAQFAAQSTPGSGNPHHLVPAGFSYMHAIPAAVQAKQAEQKQPAGE